MEKRRRARINQSLNELKNLILEAMKKDVSQTIIIKTVNNFFLFPQIFWQESPGFVQLLEIFD